MLPLLLAASLGAPLTQTSQCEQVEFAAEVADCAPGICELAEAVALKCDGLRLWADAVTVRWDEAGDFAGAEARGNVLLVDGATVMTCERLELGPDRIKGRVDAATILLKNTEHPSYQVDPSGVPFGKNEAIFHGDLVRPSEEELRIAGADFTLCDCGEDPPSWRVTARTIEAKIDERATLWWPMIYLNPFGLGLVPVTPPLPPLSVPLESRSAGFLAPNIRFLGDEADSWKPTVDLPFFVPLGDSFDVTLAPGMRFDWEAPRAGGRLRWAPLEGFGGEAKAQWTYDRDHVTAQEAFDAARESARLRANCPSDEDDKDCLSRGTYASLEERRKHLAELDHRVSVELEQQLRAGESFTWLIDGEWISDDLLPTDFGIRLDEQVSSYMPSRTEVLWRQPSLAALVAADYLLMTRPTGDFSNAYGAEAGVSHRGPAVELVLAPVTLAGPLELDASASFSRYGPWSDARAPDLLTGSGSAALGLREALGPLRFAARAAGDLLWTDPADASAGAAFLPELEGSASIALARRFGETTHRIEPRLRYAALPVEPVELGDAPLVLRDDLEERLQIRSFHQGSVGLLQGLWRADGGRIAELELDQPMALRAGKLLAARARLAIDLGRLGGISGWTSFDWRRDGERFDDAGAGLWVQVAPLRFDVSWSRWAPDAERLTRSIYELAGAGAVIEDAGWVHTARGSIRFDWQRVRLSYGIVALLPLPEDSTPKNEVDADLDRPYVGQHSASIAYASPCDCWSVVVALSRAQTADGWQDPRGSISLSVAGFEVGTAQ